MDPTYDLVDSKTGLVVVANLPKDWVAEAAFNLAEAGTQTCAIVHNCDCGAATEGKWADKHSPSCEAVA